jgi:hypothetical protein
LSVGGRGVLKNRKEKREKRKERREKREERREKREDLKYDIRY